MLEHRTIRSLGVEAPGNPYFFSYEEGPPSEGQVRLDAIYSGFSAGTELTFLKDTNPYLRSHWDTERGLFVDGEPSARFPVPFLGYMEVGRIGHSRAEGFDTGDVVAASYGHKSGHTADPFHEMLVGMPEGIDPILGVFVAQMGPIAANGILHADAEIFGTDVRRLGESLAGRTAVVFGGGTVGLLTALFAQSRRRRDNRCRAICLAARQGGSARIDRYDRDASLAARQGALASWRARPWCGLCLSDPRTVREPA